MQRSHYGDYALTHVTADLLAKARDDLSKVVIKRTAKDLEPNAPIRTLSPARVNRYLTGLSPVLTACVKEWGWLEYNPMMKVRKKKEPTGIVRFLSKDERNNLISALKEPHTSAPFAHCVAGNVHRGTQRKHFVTDMATS